MKKLLKLTITFITSILLLTACSGEKTKTYINKVNGEENQIIIYYKKDIVNKVSLTHIIKNADENIRKMNKDAISSQHSNIKGVIVNFEEKEEKLIVKWEIDYTQIDFYKAKDILGLKDSLEEERKLSNIEKRIRDAGGTEKK